MTPPAIDIHTHIVPAEFPDYAGKHGGAHWPSMAPAHDCHHKNVMIDGKNFRTVSDQCWDVGCRAEAMAKMGIARQVLSPMPELLSYWLPLDDAAPLIRHVNDTIATRVARAPDQFVGLGGVPYEHARRLYYDTLIYDAPTLRHLIGTFGVRQLCIGTDFPFDIHERTPVAAVGELKLSDGDVKLLHYDNAARFLGKAA